MIKAIEVSVSYAVEAFQIDEWLKKPGDAVSEGEVLLVYSADKVAVEVEAPVSGVLAEVVVLAGEMFFRPDDASSSSNWSAIVGYIETAS